MFLFGIVMIISMHDAVNMMKNQFGIEFSSALVCHAILYADDSLLVEVDEEALSPVAGVPFTMDMYCCNISFIRCMSTAGSLPVQEFWFVYLASPPKLNVEPSRNLPWGQALAMYS